MRMQVRTRAPLSVPALVAGIIAVVMVLLGPSLLGMIAGVGAAMMGGIAWSDTKSHGYQGHGFAVAGMILGACALGIGFLAMVLFAAS